MIAKNEENENEDRSTGYGLECSECGCRDFYVLQTRRQRNSIWRLRKCRHCGKEVRTRERIS